MLEIIGILAFVLAIIGGFKLMEYGMTYLDDYFEDFDNLLPFISFLVIFLGILILINMLGKVVKKMIDVILLNYNYNVLTKMKSIINITNNHDDYVISKEIKDRILRLEKMILAAGGAIILALIANMM